MKVHRGQHFKKRKTASVGSGYMFPSFFEERKVCEYLINLINSYFLYRKTREILQFATSVVGIEQISSFNRSDDEKAREDKGALWVTEDIMLPASFDKIDIIEKIMLPALIKKIAAIPANEVSDIDRRLNKIQETFRLTNEEKEILTFFYLAENSALLGTHIVSQHNFGNFPELSTFMGHGHVLLGIAKHKMQQALQKGIIMKAHLIMPRHNSLSLAEWCSNYLSGVTPINISTEFYDRDGADCLQIDNFAVSRDEIQVLDTLMRSKRGNNILLYGISGTGKTSFARSLAARHGKELLKVKMPETGDVCDRIRGLYATLCMADKASSVILVDEADEIINTANSHQFRNITNKSWINNFLESHDKKIIWITNRSSEVDESTMRRFAFMVEFNRFTPQQRLKVLKLEFAKKKLPSGYFSENELNDLCKRYSVNAAGIVNAIEVAAVNGKTKKETALRRIKTVLASQEKAIGTGTGAIETGKTFEQYSLDAINTSVNLKDIITAIKHSDIETPGSSHLAMLLYGMPGTGKTEYVNYLGHVLGREILLKRSSAIRSMWVGETEKNIDNAFAEAQKTGSILFFDEADSFLFPRSAAHNSWEKTCTNEILTQIETHRGIVIFATNDIEGLDPAALRRFKFKIRFDPLTAEGNVRLYESMLRPLLPDGCLLTEDHLKRIREIENLTPGDFSVVKDQHVFLASGKLSHEKMIAALQHEVSYKKNIKHAIGF